MSFKIKWISLQLLLVLGMLVLNACSSFTGSQNTDEEVYAFQLYGIDEHVIDSTQTEKPMFMSFWATWCPYCEKEMPVFEKLYQEYGDEIAFASVNLIELDSKKAVEKYIQNHHYDMPIYLDYDAIVSTQFKVSSTPTVILLDQNGKVFHRRIGAVGDNSEQYFRTLIDELLATRQM